MLSSARLFCAALVLAMLLPSIGIAQTANVSRLSFSPKNETVTVGSEFDVALYIDTAGESVNAVELHISFPADKLSVITPTAGGQSLIGAWLEAPSYSNNRGTIDFSGIVPGGIKTENGLVTTITFRAKAAGVGMVQILPGSQVLSNDGAGTKTDLSVSPMRFSVEPKPPEGISVFSDTHPFEGVAYNNSSPVFQWENPGSVFNGFSYVLDDAPGTVPDDTADSTDTAMGYTDLKDGQYYFHLKARKGRLWSGVTNFSVLVDMTPPNAFTPTIRFLDNSSSSYGIVSFSTTDALSGVDHYEVGVLNEGDISVAHPAYVESQSPYYLPKQMSRNLVVTVRAIDNAGNARDETISVKVPSSLVAFAGEHIVPILLVLLAATVLLFVSYAFLSWRSVSRFKRSLELAERAHMSSAVPYTVAPSAPLPRLPAESRPQEQERARVQPVRPWGADDGREYRIRQEAR